MAHDPFTLIVAADRHREAKGHVYVDDGATFDYRDKGEFCQTLLSLKGTSLSSRVVAGKCDFGNSVEKIYILGLQKLPEAIYRSSAGNKEALDFYIEGERILIKLPNVKITNEWEIMLLF
mmetsp:Transcript_3083/g.3318  ORF Transcript_3083/g.3318 Transcript_3083/m.3318 type:complete len:120 (+) Transcript_3083:416-775(+)